MFHSMFVSHIKLYFFLFDTFRCSTILLCFCLCSCNKVVLLFLLRHAILSNHNKLLQQNNICAGTPLHFASCRYDFSGEINVICSATDLLPTTMTHACVQLNACSISDFKNESFFINLINCTSISKPTHVSLNGNLKLTLNL